MNNILANYINISPLFHPASIYAFVPFYFSLTHLFIYVLVRCFHILISYFIQLLLRSLILISVVSNKLLFDYLCYACYDKSNSCFIGT